ncbi:MAG: dipeptidase [Candidatus Zixiibacteriota bacterium]
MNCSDRPRNYLSLHRDALVADMHSDTVLRMKKGLDLSQRNRLGHMDIPRLKDGGIDLQVFACWVDTETPRAECRAQVDSLLDILYSQIVANRDRIAVCTTAAGAEKAINEGKIAAFVGIENGVAIAGELANLEHFYERGVRYMTLTHTASSDWCVSSADTAPAFNGLTDFGREVVHKMNEMGMIIDVSHASVSAVDEVLKISTSPIIASHSCVYALCEHDRNLTDDQIKAIAAKGGVIGVNFYNGYLSKEWEIKADSIWETRREEIDSVKQYYWDNDSARTAEVEKFLEWLKDEMKIVPVNVATVVDHIDYIVKLVGPDFVGLGSDYDGVFAVPDGLDDCSMVPNITKELVARGYSDEDIRKILGGNFMRVFRQVCGGG